MSPVRYQRALALAVALGGFACDDTPRMTSGPDLPPARFSTAPGERPHHTDEYLAAVADRVPGFAGFYLRQDTLVVRLKGAVGGTPATATVREALRDDPDIARFRDVPRLLADGAVVVEASAYDARELWEFRVRILKQVFGREVHRLDQDETRGVIRIGIDPAADVDEVAARIAAVGIPAEAVAIDAMERGRREATLQDRLRPLPGGVQLAAEDEPPCTMTVNAFMSESEVWGFFTCSHCTTEFGSTGDAAYQNENDSGNLIGWEISDPPLWEPGEGYCPDTVGLGCRYSDASFFSYYSSAYPDSMTIARTNSWPPQSLTINSNSPRFAVTGPVDYLPVGLDVHKIGRTTGWTAGEVTETCVDIELDDIVTFCSWVADYASGSGDSGSPVFTWDGSSWTVGLVGNHWGAAGSDRYFSPWLYIVLEIGGELQEDLLIEY